ncbi:hypothetical protein FDA94_17245 [Herbidospora galbida]|uniref:Porin n=1 Tax=Herbidospora galbida TaxID=2575442 RepID=A0A4U3MFP2_9ACTN|nr:hypothetical protein [Herbidospora galbida]TKK87570.1 hypothetical protein FDA94_17245 [Herbidospora galbida]
MNLKTSQKAVVVAALAAGALGVFGAPALAAPGPLPPPTCDYAVDSDDCVVPPDPNMHWGNERPSD